LNGVVGVFPATDWVKEIGDAEVFDLAEKGYDEEQYEEDYTDKFTGRR